ncbi:hypothetical protein HMN09_01025800 [Mycena chlorophos]|uniref:EF-hand domain-containing protein n=1 Tax=Mycena chlorophos TaxID=658473 RepID=A0A8H6SHR2_MYCCL|nr:hypothetical protein HMN09_01025800 [Mycena chlorophos]
MADFSSLPAYLRRKIDNAFESCVLVPSSASAIEVDSGAGFIGGAGGFLTEEDEGAATQIPLSAIPSALQRLDLPPDDDAVLNVFKNAATGWTSATNEPTSSQGKELFVSREDWRSVCAVLFEHHAEEYAETGSEGKPDNVDEEEGEDAYEEMEEDESDSDEYMDEDEELGPSATRRRRPATRRRRASSSSSSHSDAPKKLTARQRKTCLETYALFFPDVSPDDLPNQRVMIKDVQRLTQLIGDKLKSEEIIEMVEEFSTSPDKSMSFADFGTMMLAAKLA